MKTVRVSEKTARLAARFAEECMGCEPSFCQARCPMHTDAKKYIHLIAEGDYTGAVKTIREALFMPSVMGYICAHPCEYECRRGREFGEAMAIQPLKRFAAEKADNESLWDLTVGKDSGKRVAVIGAGPAGAQAAVDLRRAGHAVTIYDKERKRGGMMRYGIPAYRLPRRIIDQDYTYLDRLGVQFVMGVEIGKDIPFTQLTADYDAVIIASGAWRGSIVSMSGSDNENVFTALELLYETAETGAFPRAKERVMVIGGGDVAMDAIRSAIRLPNVKEVHQCSLENEACLPASLDEKEEALEEGMKPNFGFGPTEIVVENGVIVGVKLKEVLSVFDEAHHFSPKYGTEERFIPCDTVIMATGQGVPDVTGGAIAKQGYRPYEADKDTLATNVPGVFVAGASAGAMMVVEAMALGRKAAYSADRYLTGRDLREGRDLKNEWHYASALDVPLPASAKDLPRVAKNLRPVEDRIRDFELYDLGLTEEQAKAEAERCLQCECRLCTKECSMMESAGKCPKEFADQLMTGHADEAMAYRCNDCDDCKPVCPKELPIRELYMGAREDIAASSGGRSPLREHYAVHAHQELGFSSLYTVKRKGGEQE